MDELKKEIAARLRDFCSKKFGGGLNAAARGFEMSPENLSRYWTGRSKPGNVMQERLRKAGCDLGWLFTGNAAIDVQKKIDERILLLAERGLKKEDYEMLDFLHGFGIRNRFELEENLNFEVLGKRMMNRKPNIKSKKGESK
jgi:hypothetical protein